MNPRQIEHIIEAAIFAAGSPMPVAQLAKLFDEDDRPSPQEIKDALTALQAAYQDRAIELKELGSGYQFQSKESVAPWLQKLWEERPPRYSRALIETLVLIAYRQPITRAEIEAVRGVAVSTQIVKTLLEREWVRIVGQRDVPGRPSLYATTKKFLDYFNLKGLDELPTLEEVTSLDQIEEKLTEQLNLEISEQAASSETAEPELENDLEEAACEVLVEETVG